MHNLRLRHVQSHQACPITPAVPAPKAYPLAKARSKAQAVALYHARYSRVNPLRAVSTRDIGVQTVNGGDVNNVGGKGKNKGRNWFQQLQEDDHWEWERDQMAKGLDSNKGKGKKGDSLFTGSSNGAASSSWQ